MATTALLRGALLLLLSPALSSSVGVHAATTMAETSEFKECLASPSNCTFLLVDDKKLTGTFPSEIGLLTGLEVIDVSNNRLTGSLPTELGLLKGLQFLALSHNPGLCGSFPRGLTPEYFAIFGYTNMMGPACGSSAAEEEDDGQISTTHKIAGYCAAAALWLTCLCSCLCYNCWCQAWEHGCIPDEENNKEPSPATPPLAAPPPIDLHIRENRGALYESWGYDEHGHPPSHAATTPASAEGDFSPIATLPPPSDELHDTAVDIDNDERPTREMEEVEENLLHRFVEEVDETESDMESNGDGNGTKRNRGFVVNETETEMRTGRLQRLTSPIWPSDKSTFQ